MFTLLAIGIAITALVAVAEHSSEERLGHGTLTGLLNAAFFIIVATELAGWGFILLPTIIRSVTEGLGVLAVAGPFCAAIVVIGLGLMAGLFKGWDRVDPVQKMAPPKTLWIDPRWTPRQAWIEAEDERRNAERQALTEIWRTK